MEAVPCAEHGSLCFLKTGVRDGPNKGKSFYVCGAQGPAACGFVLPAQWVQGRGRRERGSGTGVSVLREDPKAAKVSKALESQPSTAPLFNPTSQRNPFKVLDKNCAPSSWKQMKQGNGEESKAKGVKAENKSVQLSHKEKESTSDSSTDTEGLKTKKKSSTGSKSDPELQDTAVSESKFGLSETRKGENTLSEEEKCGRESKKPSECVDKEPDPRSKLLPLSLGKQSINTKPPVQEQLGEKSFKNCTGQKNGEMQVMSKDVTCPAGAQSASQCPALRGGAEAELPKTQIGPGLPQSAGEGSGSDSDKVQFVSSSSGKSKPEKSDEIPSGKSGKNVQKTSLPGAAASHHMEGPQDPKMLHNHLVVQLKQKKTTLATVNIELLPDKGQRLLKQVQDLEASLSALNISTADTSEKGRANFFFSSESKVLRFTVQPFQPVIPFSLRAGQLNFGVQNLYGGRMTEDRIRAVHSAIFEAVNHLHKSLESCPTEETAAEDPSGLKVPLLQHQKQALAWLLWRESQRPCGGILADDMGLGKTLTMIALILAQKQLKTEKRKETLEIWLTKNDSTVVPSHSTLVICPASLIHHWKKEIERRVAFGKLRVYLYHGPNRDKHAEVLSGYDVVVTTYSLLSKEVPTSKEEGEVPSGSSPCSPLLKVAWARIILDEAHNIKNPRVQTSIAVCKLRASARWAVTGTPIQNNLLDMYSLLRFLRCSPFDEYKVWKYQVDNNTRKGGERLSLLTRTLLLQRTKNQLDSAGKPLVSLPQRSTQLHQLKLSAEEQAVYNVLFARSRSTLQSYLKRQEQKNEGREYDGGNPFEKVAREFGVSQKEFLTESQSASQVSSTVHVLSMLLRLRQCCCHLSLLKVALDQVNLNSEGLALSIEEQLGALTLSELHTPDSKSTVYLNGTAFQTDIFEVTRESTKIAQLLAELKTIQSHSEPQKSVVVSQWTSMLKVVAVHLQRLGLKYATVDGSVNPKQRMDVVEEFNNNPKGPQVMLVSLLAGGVGLNLTGGNHLFLLDMHWNPALEDQACDRIYRVGQKKDVVIHRFVCEGTVEEKILQLQKRKKGLAQQVLAGKGETFTKLTLADLKILFGI
uniref:Transcription termination factor 2 n=1 Tax=Malurus cyaneus samueli TaxID=2593467 RepID=A0A8C5U7M2_9PASS